MQHALRLLALFICSFSFAAAQSTGSTAGSKKLILVHLKAENVALNLHPLDNRLEVSREYISLAEKEAFYNPTQLAQHDVQLIDDDCFQPTHKLIYKTVTYVVSLDCHTVRKFANVSDFISGKQELENDAIFSRNLAATLMEFNSDVTDETPSQLEQTNAIDESEVLSEMADLVEDEHSELIESNPDTDPSEELEDIEEGIEDEVDSKEAYIDLLRTYLVEESRASWDEDQQWLDEQLEASESLHEERDDLALADEDLTREIEAQAPVPLVHSEFSTFDNAEHEQEVIDYLHTFNDEMSPLDIQLIFEQMGYVVETGEQVANHKAELAKIYDKGFQKTEAMLAAEPEVLEDITETEKSAEDLQDEMDAEVIALKASDFQQIEEAVSNDEESEMYQLLGMADIELDTF